MITPARIAVIQTSSERDHNSEAGTGAFRRLATQMPWLTFEFFDESTVAALVDGITESKYSAVVFASNSLYNETIYRAANASASQFRKASAEGMGIVVLQQFLLPGDSRSCDFLPVDNQATYFGIPATAIEDIAVNPNARCVDSQESLALSPDDFGVRAPTTWCRIQPLHPAEWRVFGTVSNDGTDFEAMFRSRNPRGRVLLTTLPLDWLPNSSLLAHFVARAARSLGTLYINHSSESLPNELVLRLELGRAATRGGHIASVAASDIGSIDPRHVPYRHFSHIIVSPHWTWGEMSGLLQTFRFRLENEGSLTAQAAHSTDGRPILVTIGERPRYLLIADQFAQWFERHVEEFTSAPAPAVRALAAVIAAIRDACADPEAVPRQLSGEMMQHFIEGYAERRLGGRVNVDGHVMPTAAVAAAMALVDSDRSKIDPLQEWVQKQEYVSSNAAKQQARLWLPAVRLTHGFDEGNEVEHLYHRLLQVQQEKCGTDDLSELGAMLRNPGLPLSVRAIVADSLSSASSTQARGLVADSIGLLKDDWVAALRSDHPPLESICLLTATMVRVHAACGFASGLGPDERESTQPQPSAREADLRRDLELARQALSSERSNLDRVRSFASLSMGTAVVCASAIPLLIAVWVLSAFGADVTTWLAVLIPLVTVVASLVAFAGLKAASLQAAPKWLRALGEVMQSTRGG